MQIDKERLLKILDQFGGDVGYLTALLEKLFTLFPTPYLDAYIEKYFYEHVYAHPFYEIYNEYSSNVHRAPTREAARQLMMHELGISELVARTLLSGQTKRTKEGYRVRKITKKEAIEL